MTGLVELYSRMRFSIVAFAPKYPQMMGLGEFDHLKAIFGTGFIIGDSTVATNTHVANLFDSFPKPEHDKGIAVVAIMSLNTPGGIGTCLLNVCDAAMVKSVSPTGFHYQQAPPDIAVVSMQCRGLSDYALECSPTPVAAGTEVATAGFPTGSDLLAPCGVIERFGPVLQRGIVCSESPFCGVEPHSYLIDVMVQGGASGSPVFNTADGKVIGVLYASQLEPHLVQLGIEEAHIPLPTSFSYVVPSHFLLKVIKESEERLYSRLPANTPSLKDILDSMPQEPVDQITIGRFQHPNANTSF